jgi:hypothetical protein
LKFQVYQLVLARLEYLHIRIVAHAPIRPASGAGLLFVRTVLWTGEKRWLYNTPVMPSIRHAILLSCILGLAPFAHAGVTAVYTGNYFDTLFGDGGGDTLSGFISVSLAFSAPLAPNLSFSSAPEALLTSWSITDNLGHTLGSATGDDLLDFELSTDSSGNVTAEWNMSTGLSGGGFHLQTNSCCGGAQDTYQGTTGGVYVNSTPGLWVTTVTPEPSSAGLLLGGLAWLAAAVRRRRPR